MVTFEEPGELKRLIDSIYGFIGVYLPDGTLVDCNSSPLEAAGLRRDDVMGLPFWRTPWWSHSRLEQNKIRQAIESAARGRAIRDEFTVNLGDNGIITIDASFEPYCNEQGIIERVIGFGVDVTEWKKTEEALLSKEKLLFEAEKAGMLELWEFDFASQRIEFYSDDSFFVKSGIGNLEDLAQRIHADDRNQVMADLLDAREGRTSRYQHVYRLYLSDGSMRHVTTRARVINNFNGEPVKLVGASIDITTETELANQYRNMLEAAVEGLVHCNSEGIIQLANESMCSLSGFDMDSLVGRDIDDVIPGTMAFIRTSTTNMPTGPSSRMERQGLKMKNGRAVSVGCSFFPRQDSQVILSVRDEVILSDRMHSLLESQKGLVNLTERMRRIEEEARADLAHEIHDEVGQNLTYIKFGLAKLRECADLAGGDSGPFLDKAMADIDRTITSIRRITTMLRHPLLDDIGLEAAMQSQAREYREHYDFALDMDIELGDIVLCEDRKIAIFRIFQEAITNVARHARASCVKVRLLVEEGKIKLEIVDDGVGFNVQEKDLPTLTGILGMRHRVSSLSGDFTISNGEEKGTIVRVTIPVP